MNVINDHIQVYSVWVNGRFDENNHYPINSNVKSDWHVDFKKAVDDYFNVIVADGDDEIKDYSKEYMDYIVILFSIDMCVSEFENLFDIKFDINDDRVQELIPDFANYGFNVTAERIGLFN